ncbi:MAG: amino acid ABC transporter substrate-binding protein, partial [Limnobacter sp.]|nr:amino acid ABC transporter substrate-binding protein [Limnobacter sp.]
MKVKLLATLVSCAALASIKPAIADDHALTGTLKKVDETGVLVLGHRESSVPFSYLDNEQKPIGYSMDLCIRIDHG